MDRSQVQRYASLSNCKLLQIPFVYLGIPIGSNPRREEIWDPIVMKFNKKNSLLQN